MALLARALHQTLDRLEAACRQADVAGRVAVLEALERDVLGRLAGGSGLEAVAERAEVLQARLEGRLEALCERLRRRVRAGRYTPAGLARALARHAGPQAGEGYDALDWLVHGLLEGGELEGEIAAPGGERVGYQPTPARVVLALIAEAAIGPDDCFYDLGAGLGTVVLLVALLTGAEARGIELEPAYCAYAAAAAQRLGLDAASFLCDDLARAPLSGGTVYFLYTPVRGRLLAELLERLRREAEARPLRVCTYGPCTPEVAGLAAAWLTPVGPPVPDRVVVFNCRQAAL